MILGFEQLMQYYYVQSTLLHPFLLISFVVICTDPSPQIVV